MRKVVENTGSRRKLTARHLEVDWHGHGTLFFQMTKTQMRDVLKGSVRRAETKELQYNDGREARPFAIDTASFDIYRSKDGSLAIGCEYFTPAEVKELKKWAGKTPGKARKGRK